MCFGNDEEPDFYCYHTDQLGSSKFIYDSSGESSQHLEYLPFGEPFIEERTGWDTPYKFSGKELDEETQYYYFGARYYDPKISIWLSVDPLADKYPSHSPYNYTLNNPIMLIDPDGRWVKGAGFFRNLLKSDDRINAENRATDIGGDARPIKNGKNGGWNVVYTTGETADFGSGKVKLNTLNIENFDKNRKQGGTVNRDDYGSISAYKPNWADAWYDRSQQNIISKLTYEMSDGVYVTLQSPFSGPNTKHINGSTVYGNDRVDAFVSSVETGLLASQIKPLHSAKNGWHFYDLGYHSIGKHTANYAGYAAGDYLHLNILGRHLILGKNFFKNLKYFKHLK